jgi:dynein heavy chain
MYDFKGKELEDLCDKIFGYIEEIEWSFFLRGGGLLRGNTIDKPPIRWLTDSMWHNCLDLAESLGQFHYITEHIISYTSDWETLIESDNPFSEQIPGDVTGQFTDFHRLLLIKVLREEKLMPSIIEFTKKNLGAEFIDIPPLDLANAYKDTSCRSPLIFILSAGSDPVASLMKFASSKSVNMLDRLHMISLGQGQGPIADELIKKASQTGDWVFLQNCHLSASWMNRLENLVKEFASPDSDVHENFRLFLSSMPSRTFPISVLQESAKVTNEPPKGLKANLARSFADISKDLFDEHPPQGIKFKKLLFGVCFFNAAIQERKKFGPLGWNINYDWSNSDLDVSISMLKNTLQDNKNIPWSALLYLTGDITFGGRVTDDWDRRTLGSVLSKYYNKDILEDSYKFSPSGIYYAPPDGDLSSFRAYIDSLPFEEDPSIFDMHENANISFQLQETRRVIKTILDVQPRLVSGGSGQTSEELVHMVATSILKTWPEPILLEIPSNDDGSSSNSVLLDLFRKDNEGRMINSLSTVLSQEVVRFNKLLLTIKQSLETLVKAVKGLVVMSAELELVFKSLLINEVPLGWASASYLSLKSLASWIKDFNKRVQFLRDWTTTGQPNSFWMSGLFFPQGKKNK